MLIAAMAAEEELVVKLARVPIVCEYPSVLPEDLPGLPPIREIEFCIDCAKYQAYFKTGIPYGTNRDG